MKEAAEKQEAVSAQPAITQYKEAHPERKDKHIPASTVQSRYNANLDSTLGGTFVRSASNAWLTWFERVELKNWLVDSSKSMYLVNRYVNFFA